MTNGDSEDTKPNEGDGENSRGGGTAPTSQVEALKPIFRGGRFDGVRGYPADALNELAAFAKMVESAALSLHRENEQRQRARRGYAERIRLRLQRVDQGSQVPVLCCAAEAVDVNREAADWIIGQLNDVAAIDPDLQRLCKAFGRTLADDESIEIPGMGRSFSYTSHVRKRVLSVGGQTYTDDVDLLCRITKTNTPERDDPSLTLRLPKGGEVKLRMGRDEIRRALDRRITDRLLQVRGTAQFQADASISEIAFVEEIKIIDEGLRGAKEPLVDQFDQLAGAGVDVDTNFRLFLEYCIAEGLEWRPYIIATDDGIEAEWQIERTNTTATLMENGRVYVHVSDLESKVYREETVTCDYYGALSLVALWRRDSDG